MVQFMKICSRSSKTIIYNLMRIWASQKVLPTPRPFSPPRPSTSLLFCSSSVCPSLCCCCATADGGDCLVLLIWQVSLPSCYLSASVCAAACVCLCVTACVCVSVCGTVRVCQKAAAVSYTQCTHGLIWTHSHRHYCGIYGLLFYRIILRVCLQDALIWSIFLLNWWAAKSLPRCSPHRSHICVLLPSYITTLFTSWAANHQCNFHCPSVVAITSLPFYIHFMIWLICWGSIHPYWLR